MKFLSDQELFPDIGADGKPDPDKFSGSKTVAYVFRHSAMENKSDSLRVSYRAWKDSPDNGPQDWEVSSALRDYVEAVFKQASDDAYEHTKDGCIGQFPSGKLLLNEFSNDDGTCVKAELDLDSELSGYDPICISALQDLRKEAKEAKKNMWLSRLGLFFMLLHFFIVLMAALPLIPAMAQYNIFDLGYNWIIFVSAGLSLVIAWLFHVGTMHIIPILGVVHMIFVMIFLGWQAGNSVSVNSRAIQAGIVLVLILIALIRYGIDSFGGSFREARRTYADWYDLLAPDTFRKLRFFALWYQNINGHPSYNLQEIEKELRELLSKRKP